MPMGDSALSLNTLFQHQNYNYDEYRVGAEYTYNDMVSLRAGFDLPASADDDTYIFGTSFGVGLNLGIAGRDVQLDYAYTAAEYFDALNTFAFKLDFSA